jgi:hypothetical protein
VALGVVRELDPGFGLRSPHSNQRIGEARHMKLRLPTEIPDVGFTVTTRQLRKRYESELAVRDVGLQVPALPR